MEALHRLVVHAQEALGGALLGELVLQVPDAVPVLQLLVGGPALGSEHKPRVTGTAVTQLYGPYESERYLGTDPGVWKIIYYFIPYDHSLYAKKKLSEIAQPTYS